MTEAGVPEGGVRKVVVAVDPAKEPTSPLRLGRQLARALRSPIVLVTVLPHHPLMEGPEDELQRAARDEARDNLLEIGQSLEGVHVADALAITGTSPARALQDVSEGADAAVIVVGSTTRGPLRRIVPGSVAERLVSGAACPVAVAPHGYGDAENEELDLVGVAFDGSEESQGALEAAVELTRRASAGLRVITVRQPLAFGAIPVSANRPADSINRLLEQSLRGAHDAAVAAHSGTVNVEGVFRPGSPTQVLAEESRELDLLVAGSRGYGPVGAVLLGGTTHGLLRSAECPLMIIPRGRGPELREAPQCRGGLAAIELLWLAESHAAVLVTGTAARTGLDRILIGSVPRALAAAALCAVPAGAALQEPGPIVTATTQSAHSLRAARHAAALSARLGRELMLIDVIGDEGVRQGEELSRDLYGAGMSGLRDDPGRSRPP